MGAKTKKWLPRALLALGVALGVLGTALIGRGPAPVGAGSAVEAAPRAKLRFSKHAEQRLRQRKVAREDVERLVAEGQPFTYKHEGKAKQGYYDASTGLFVATVDGVVLTVIADATQRYVEKLRRSRPAP